MMMKLLLLLRSRLAKVPMRVKAPVYLLKLGPGAAAAAILASRLIGLSSFYSALILSWKLAI